MGAALGGALGAGPGCGTGATAVLGRGMDCTLFMFRVSMPELEGFMTPVDAAFENMFEARLVGLKLVAMGTLAAPTVD